MLRIKTRMGLRGQIVIPKAIRESIGLSDKRAVILEVDNKSIRLMTESDEDLVKSWEEIANKYGGNVSKEFIYGDKLYEEIF